MVKHMSYIDSLNEQETKDYKFFTNIYNCLHPEVKDIDFSYKRDNELFEIYDTFLTFWEYIFEGYQALWIEDSESAQELIDGKDQYEDCIGVWLLDGSPVDITDELLATFISNVNDENLTVSDHAILLYVSLFEEKEFEGVPLSMLQDVFVPIAHHKFALWSEAK
jgi:hypothetical protein